MDENSAPHRSCSSTCCRTCESVALQGRWPGNFKYGSRRMEIVSSDLCELCKHVFRWPYVGSDYALFCMILNSPASRRCEHPFEYVDTCSWCSRDPTNVINNRPRSEFDTKHGIFLPIFYRHSDGVYRNALDHLMLMNDGTEAEDAALQDALQSRSTGAWTVALWRI